MHAILALGIAALAMGLPSPHGQYHKSENPHGLTELIFVKANYNVDSGHDRHKRPASQDSTTKEETDVARVG
ncbi:hypothetical protein E4U46_002182 [Claviceps purpurea]|nr:hypothetical protein E4U46_002182 [Claviceps purpurea]